MMSERLVSKPDVLIGADNDYQTYAIAGRSDQSDSTPNKVSAVEAGIAVSREKLIKKYGVHFILPPLENTSVPKVTSIVRRLAEGIRDKEFRMCLKKN